MAHYHRSILLGKGKPGACDPACQPAVGMRSARTHPGYLYLIGTLVPGRTRRGRTPCRIGRDHKVVKAVFAVGQFIMMRVGVQGRSLRRDGGHGRHASVRFILFAVLLAGYAIAGGASRPDQLGQVVSRGLSTLVLLAIVLLGDLHFRHKSLWLLVAGAAGLAVLQLVPLPPSMWGLLPAAAGGIKASGWRTISQNPGATYNALFSLLTPITILALSCGSAAPLGRDALRALILLVLASSLVALFQVADVFPDNIFINETLGAASGFLANRNHQALLLSIGIVLLPGWVILPVGVAPWRIWCAAGAAIWLVLMILATGSRAGILLALLALAFDIILLGLSLRRRAGRAWLRSQPQWMRLALPLSAVLVITLPVALSLVANRALSVERAIDLNAGDDIRIRAAPTIFWASLDNLPFGTGLGSFDSTFRMVEPFELLKPTYFNHAHNEFLEIALDAGLPGLALLAVALFWWIRGSIRAWRDPVHGPTLPRLGAMALFLIIVASFFDYPLRTPIMAAVATVAAIWLNGSGRRGDRSTLPRS